MTTETTHGFRIAERFQVRLLARFESARSFVEEYAHNLSEGGLFIAGAFGLEPLQQVEVALDLPGSGVWNVTCRVAHVRSPEEADRIGQPPGAGMAIMLAPPGFREALLDYLKLLGRRRDVVVLTPTGPVRDFLTSAGFRTEPLPPWQEVASCLQDRPSVVGILAADNFLEYLHALTPQTNPYLILEETGEQPSDLLLQRLDEAVKNLLLTPSEAVA